MNRKVNRLADIIRNDNGRLFDVVIDLDAIKKSKGEKIMKFEINITEKEMKEAVTMLRDLTSDEMIAFLKDKSDEQVFQLMLDFAIKGKSGLYSDKYSLLTSELIGKFPRRVHMLKNLGVV